jgi:hypothetical protein
VYNSAPSPAASGSNTLKIVAVVGVLGVMIVAAAGIAVALIYFNKDARPANKVISEPNRPAQSPTSTPMTSPTPASSDTNQLKEQIANLEKRINQQKNANQAANSQPVKTTTARVNSPGDGFLALRTMPSSTAGSRILQIPHGAVVSVGGCMGAGRAGSGRWCRASYNGFSGWVYDSYLIY